MPRAPGAGNELDQYTVAADEEMSGYFRAGDGGIERVRPRVEAVGEEIDDAAAAELPRRQADVVDDEEVYRATRGPSIAVGRRNEPYAFNQTFVIDAQSLWRSDWGSFLNY